MTRKATIADCIGSTPMVTLNRITPENGAVIHAKLELFNPGGSLKDRTALGLIEEAENKGILKPGITLVEATSGNMGLGLAHLTASKGLRLVLVMSEKNRGMKSDLASSLGAELIFTPEDVPWDSGEGPLGVAEKLAETEPETYYLNQFNNHANSNIHYRTTGSEIIDDTGGKVDVFVAGIGSGGTITGVARRLKEVNPDVAVYGVAAVGSIFDVQHEKEGYIEGIGSDFLPGIYNADLVDKVLIVDPDRAIDYALNLLKMEGIPAGHSSGAVLAACFDVSKRHPGANIVAIMADTMRNYDYWRIKP
ncbi:PLP-dependent cysteine synthase family protein [Acidobacteriota bacterium]